MSVPIKRLFEKLNSIFIMKAYTLPLKHQSSIKYSFAEQKTLNSWRDRRQKMLY